MSLVFFNIVLETSKRAFRKLFPPSAARNQTLLFLKNTILLVVNPSSRKALSARYSNPSSRDQWTAYNDLLAYGNVPTLKETLKHEYISVHSSNQLGIDSLKTSNSNFLNEGTSQQSYKFKRNINTHFTWTRCFLKLLTNVKTKLQIKIMIHFKTSFRDAY